MPEPLCNIASSRFSIEQGTRVLVQVPQEAAGRLLQAILAQEPLHWGDYDQVAYTSSAGVQQFRTLPQARNRATEQAVAVACVELQVFVPKRGQDLEPLLCAIYHAHPYEEPVIQLIPAARSLHRRGQDESNPNRFWNQEAADWVPEIHR
ncbi:hypothetical protein [Pseudophaeobacter sp. EL27]|uniref:hypothetical protein n=1 Tax=Pseudophaeobacter sp. EL27 TaxID=2107580 RepID=UPI000EFC6E33|nr:hypothetical protein [Pseudophaeobacter sp. EL27]